MQSIIDGRITVNFENAGKVVIDGSEVVLEELLHSDAVDPR